MKLILANNQSDKFVAFYKELQAHSSESFDYAGYQDLLFWFDGAGTPQMEVWHTKNGNKLGDYDGVYINGYLPVYELAAAVSVCCDHFGIAFVNQEMRNPPSLSKLSMHVKLAAASVPTPRSFAGTKQVLLRADQQIVKRLSFPVVLKRADADRGIDNFKLKSWEDVKSTLEPYESKTIWILQEFVSNDGYYLVSFYDQKPSFGIYRALEKRPDGNEKKAHFYKPEGGSNARLIDVAGLPPELLDTCQRAINAMNRQIGSVDCLFDSITRQARVLEVNYNPQMVTIETFKEVRQQAFVDNLKNIKH